MENEILTSAITLSEVLTAIETTNKLLGIISAGIVFMLFAIIIIVSYNLINHCLLINIK